MVVVWFSLETHFPNSCCGYYVHITTSINHNLIVLTIMSEISVEHARLMPVIFSRCSMQTSNNIQVCTIFFQIFFNISKIPRRVMNNLLKFMIFIIVNLV